jgi:hypothetical protein
VRNRLLYLALREDGHVPLARAQRHGSATHFAENVAALSVAKPSEFRNLDAPIAGIDRNLILVGELEAIAQAFALELRERRAPGEEIKDRRRNLWVN